MGKIKCKHGLDYKQEFEARKIRQKILDKDPETTKHIQDMVKKWAGQQDLTILEFLKAQGDVVYYSAIKRLLDSGVALKDILWNS